MKVEGDSLHLQRRPASKERYPAATRHLLEEARGASARSVNKIMMATYWEISRRIVKQEEQGRKRATPER